jgi:cobalt-zinc-cadmium efflux system outer membrane protein
MRFVFARPIRVRCWIWALLLLVPPVSGAQGVDEPTGELTLGRAVQAALARNPELVASEYDLKAADARIAQAGLRPNPEVSLDLENFAGTGAVKGVDALETTLSLSQVVELGGKRALRRELAQRDRDVVTIERQAQQMDVLADLTQRFIELVAAQDRLGLAASSRDIAQRTLDAISVRVQAARSPELERSRARIALIRAQLEEQQAQSELRGMRQSLAALWGSSAPAFGRASADLFALERVASFEDLVRKLERNPDFLRFASDARLREAELKLARAQARPDVTFEVGVRRLQDSHDQALVAGFSVPLRVFNRNQGTIREAEARLAQSDAQRNAAFLRAQAAVYRLYQQLQASRARMETLRAEALPQAQQALDQTQFGYDRGRFSYLELATVQQELLDLRASVIEAAADYHRTLTEIERLTGEPVSAEAL